MFSLPGTQYDTKKKKKKEKKKKKNTTHDAPNLMFNGNTIYVKGHMEFCQQSCMYILFRLDWCGMGYDVQKNVTYSLRDVRCAMCNKQVFYRSKKKKKKKKMSWKGEVSSPFQDIFFFFVLRSGTILSLRLIMKSFLRSFFNFADSRREVVSYLWKIVHWVLVDRLEGLSLPRKSVVR